MTTSSEVAAQRVLEITRSISPEVYGDLMAITSTKLRGSAPLTMGESGGSIFDSITDGLAFIWGEAKADKDAKRQAELEKIAAESSAEIARIQAQIERERIAAQAARDERLAAQLEAERVEMERQKNKMGDILSGRNIAIGVGILAAVIAAIRLAN